MFCVHPQGIRISEDQLGTLRSSETWPSQKAGTLGSQCLCHVCMQQGQTPLWGTLGEAENVL